MPVEESRTYTDINGVVGGYLRDLAFAQSSQQKMFGYKRAAAAILALDVPLTDLVGPDGALPRISGIGPGSTRVIREILDTGESATIEHAIEQSDRRADIERRRRLRRHFLSRAEVRRVLSDPALAGPTLQQYRGDLQMHSEWSDGYPTVQEIADACLQRGYQYAAVTDHSYGLKIAGGMSMAEAAEQRRAIDEVNDRSGKQFRLLQGVEANIDADGRLDLAGDEAASFDVVLAAPHSRLRKDEDQTDRMLAAIVHPAVRILAHPRGRIAGSRAGVIANWDTVFASAAQRGVAIEIDGDPARQDLDYTLAARASEAGCVFALDSDAHITTQLSYAETALAHARLAGIAVDRIVNCWPLDRLLGWLSNPVSERRQNCHTDTAPRSTDVGRHRTGVDASDPPITAVFER
jgi:putative hydrolase